jgi:excisionase family DNA binding protein
VTLIDAKGAGRLLDVPHTWVLREARAGRIPHVKLGRYTRFDLDQLELWWRNRARDPVFSTSEKNKAGPATLERPGP